MYESEDEDEDEDEDVAAPSSPLIYSHLPHLRARTSELSARQLRGN